MNKLLVVTGGTKGIGRAIIEKFAPHQFDVITCSRNLQDLEQLKEDLKRSSPSSTVEIFKANMADHEEVKAFSQFINLFERPVDVLVNNAGYFVPGEILTEPSGTLEGMINANLYSAYHITRGLIRPMKSRKQGHIFNICSIASLMAYKNGGSYAISKFALLGFSKCIREELKEHGVRVTSVMPGATFTSSWEGSGLPQERFMPVEDIADMIYAAYCLSGRSVVEDLLIRPQLGDI